jgi:hypothetical protein
VASSHSAGEAWSSSKGSTPLFELYCSARFAYRSGWARPKGIKSRAHGCFVLTTTAPGSLEDDTMTEQFDSDWFIGVRWRDIRMPWYGRHGIEGSLHDLGRDTPGSVGPPRYPGRRQSPPTPRRRIHKMSHRSSSSELPAKCWNRLERRMSASRFKMCQESNHADNTSRNNAGPSRAAME